MGRDTDILSAMIETGCSREQIAVVIRVLKEGRSSGAARQARYRARLKENRNGDVTHNVTGDVTPPSPLSPSPLPPAPSLTPPPISPSPARVARQKPRSQLSEDAEPSERDRAVAGKAAMTDATIDLEWQRFRAHHLAKGSLMANWGQAWVTWVTNWKSFGAKQSPAPPSSGSKTGPPRNGGTYKPGLGMVYPDGTVYSMLHGRREAKHREHDSEQDEAEDDKPGPPARSHSGAAGRGHGFSEAEARPPGRL